MHKYLSFFFFCNPIIYCKLYLLFTQRFPHTVVYYYCYSPFLTKFTWRRCGPNEGPRWAQGNPFGRTCIYTDAMSAWTTGKMSAAPAIATAAPAAAGAAAAAAAAVAAAAVAAVAAEFAAAAVAAARRPVGSEARCPVPIW